ncbi:hypothetical protein C8J56DRAFT_784100, partial [Mycena floridula]
NAGFVGLDNGKILEAIATRLRSRRAQTKFRIQNSPAGTEEGHSAAKGLAKAGTKKRTADVIPDTGPTRFGIRGIKVTEITESLAYKAILLLKIQLSGRTTTERNILAIQRFVKNKVGKEPTNHQIWLSIRCRTMPPRIHNFFYLAIHGGQQIGHWWKYIPECQDCQFCHKCRGVEETMSHILFECEVSMQRVVWNLTQTLFEKKGGIWPGTSLAMILGCNLMDFDDGSNRKIKRPGLTRLFRTLIPLAAHLIWKSHCNILVKGKPIPGDTETHNKWVHAVNERLQADCLLTNRFR